MNSLYADNILQFVDKQYVLDKFKNYSLPRGEATALSSKDARSMANKLRHVRSVFFLDFLHL